MELQVEASTTALGLLALLQQIETEFGRQRGGERNQARTLDVDLISYDNQTLESAVLTLPHPRAAQRKFVLMPLAQISPKTILPGQSASIIQLLGSLPDQDNVQPLA
jgi:2-amino-4-hydroxy-6-hydroxymethyldihydropteridine diphosphokinase